MPYYGIGAGFYDFNSSYTGNPTSVYLPRGGIIKAFSAKSLLKYEWNFGTSFSWKRYNPVTNPKNKVIGTPMNICFAANLYHGYVLSKNMNLNAGVTFNHVSNGAMRTSNFGVNTISAFVELSYYFERECIINEFNPTLRAPEYNNSRLISDITLNSTIRQRKYDTEKTGLSSPYIDKKFLVANAGYALLHMPSYKYRYGLRGDVVYDKSSGATVKRPE
ncbi:MAG: acyloxyacyl hydrolase [Prevotellaceae bacterium]|jgi:hypothetical protein|nr:acyloxyacyl hydrolase [Prevotellaceae bacterium]